MENKLKKGYIDLHIDYISEKFETISSLIENIKNIQKGEAIGFNDEIYSNLKTIEDYINFFLKNYEFSNEED